MRLNGAREDLRPDPSEMKREPKKAEGEIKCERSFSRSGRLFFRRSRLSAR